MRAFAVTLIVLVNSNLAFSDGSEVCETTCGEFGTTVIFADSPAAAAKQALAEEKLVFVLHVSGEFETPEYT